MDERIENQEIIEGSDEIEVLDDVYEENEEESVSLIESIATVAVLMTPLAVSYVAGVVSSDKVKNGIVSIKTKFSERSEKRKAKMKEIKERRNQSDEDVFEVIEDSED